MTLQIHAPMQDVEHDQRLGRLPENQVVRSFATVEQARQRLFIRLAPEQRRARPSVRQQSRGQPVDPVDQCVAIGQRLSSTELPRRPFGDLG